MQAHFLSILPRIENHAQIRFRHLRCPGEREDAIAETIAIAWKWYLSISGRGKTIDDFVMTLADLAVRHVRSGRRLCGQEHSRDVLSSRAQRTKGFRVERLPSSTQRAHEALHGDPHAQSHTDAFEERLKDNTQTPPDEQAAFRIDYRDWLSQLGERNRRIVVDMALELGTGELAARHRVSPGRISQLRKEFHATWQHFHGEPVAC
jgi:hypothetical protein